MMNSPLVSIVIPVYNSEAFIERCLISVLSQDYEDLEVIIVDDGSTDNSLGICKKHESSKIRIISQANSGASAARNTGIKNCSSKSDYLFFVDSDDVIRNDYVSCMIKHSSIEGLSLCDFGSYQAERQVEKFYQNSANSVSFDSPFENESFLKLLVNGLINSLCNKCFSFKIIKDHGLFIPEGYPEDIRFCLNYLRFCKSVTFVPEKLYFYIKRSGSVTGRGYEDLYDNYIKLQEYLYSIVPDKFHRYVSEFVYPQYLANTRKFIKNGDYTTPKKYLKNRFVRRAISEHKSTCSGDALIKYLFKFGLLSLL